MKLRSFKWGDAKDPAHVVIDVELASLEEVTKMIEFLNWLEREGEGIPVDKGQELQEDYEKNKPNLCPHDMNPVSCPTCMMLPRRPTGSTETRERQLKQMLSERKRNGW